MEKQAYVYILSNRHNTTLYIGVTSDLEGRMYKHKARQHKGFTAKYNVDKLVYFETTDSIVTAIEREKQLKGWRRSRKVELINRTNPGWRDLAINFEVHRG